MQPIDKSKLNSEVMDFEDTAIDLCAFWTFRHNT